MPNVGNRQHLPTVRITPNLPKTGSAPSPANGPAGPTPHRSTLRQPLPSSARKYPQTAMSPCAYPPIDTENSATAATQPTHQRPVTTTANTRARPHPPAQNYLSGNVRTEHHPPVAYHPIPPAIPPPARTNFPERPLPTRQDGRLHHGNGPERILNRNHSPEPVLGFQLQIRSAHHTVSTRPQHAKAPPENHPDPTGNPHQQPAAARPPGPQQPPPNSPGSPVRTRRPLPPHDPTNTRPTSRPRPAKTDVCQSQRVGNGYEPKPTAEARPRVCRRQKDATASQTTPAPPTVTYPPTYLPTPPDYPPRAAPQPETTTPLSMRTEHHPAVTYPRPTYLPTLPTNRQFIPTNLPTHTHSQPVNAAAPDRQTPPKRRTFAARNGTGTDTQPKLLAEARPSAAQAKLPNRPGPPSPCCPRLAPSVRAAASVRQPVPAPENPARQTTRNQQPRPPVPAV